MKALTICQPYAELICLPLDNPRHKRVENREWPTRYRGPLLIHAGKSRAWLNGETDAELEEEFGRKVEFGALVARSRLAACLHIDHIKRGDYDKQYPWLKEHAHTNGTWCWVLEDVRRLRAAVPYRGAQGLWDFHEPIEFCDHGIDIDSACAYCMSAEPQPAPTNDGSA